MKRNNHSFDQLKVGDYAHKEIEVTLEMLSNYIELSGDDSKIHQSDTFARAAGFNGQIVHGTLISSFYSALIGTKLPGDSGLLVEMSCKFHKPAYVGESIFITATVLDKHESVQCISIKFEAYNEENNKLSSGKALVKIR